jgi:hypothetical protein
MTFHEVELGSVECLIAVRRHVAATSSIESYEESTGSDRLGNGR